MGTTSLQPTDSSLVPSWLQKWYPRSLLPTAKTDEYWMWSNRKRQISISKPHPSSVKTSKFMARKFHISSPLEESPQAQAPG